MTLKQLNEFEYNGFGGDDHLNPDGSKKPWKHERAEDPEPNEDLIKTEKELDKKQKQLKALNIKISRTKSETQKYSMTMDRKDPL